jgi:uncharacterized membrane protein YhaH (DUF805 family)
MGIFIDCVKNHYSDFDGKSTRKEFWLFTAFFAVLTLALAFICGFISGLTTASAIRWLYLVFVLLMISPQVAVAVRRFHDVGKSGKLLLVGLIPIVGLIVVIVWLCGKTTTVQKSANGQKNIKKKK